MVYTSVIHCIVYSRDIIHLIVSLTGALIVAFYNTDLIYIERIFTPYLILILLFTLILVLIKLVVLLVSNSFFDSKVLVYIHKLISRKIIYSIINQQVARAVHSISLKDTCIYSVCIQYSVYMYM